MDVIESSFLYFEHYQHTIVHLRSLSAYHHTHLQLTTHKTSHLLADSYQLASLCIPSRRVRHLPYITNQHKGHPRLPRCLAQRGRVGRNTRRSLQMTKSLKRKSHPSQMSMTPCEIPSPRALGLSLNDGSLQDLSGIFKYSRHMALRPTRPV